MLPIRSLSILGVSAFRFGQQGRRPVLVLAEKWTLSTRYTNGSTFLQSRTRLASDDYIPKPVICKISVV